MPDHVSVALSRRPVGLSQWTGDSPNAMRLRPVIRVSEEWSGWMLGRLTRYPDVCVELGFEDWRKFLDAGWTLGGTAIVYLRFDQGRDCLFEAQFGRTVRMPSDEMLQEVRSLLMLFDGYAPFMLPPRMITKERLPHELPVQPLPVRQDRRNRQSLLRKKRHQKKAGMSRMRVPIFHP
jgi:hypothetical protein